MLDDMIILETGQYIGPPDNYQPIFNILNSHQYTNFYRYFSVLVYSTVCTIFIYKLCKNLSNFIEICSI